MSWLRAFCRPRLLPGGRAAAGWGRALRRRLTRLHDLDRLAAWLDDSAAGHLALQQGPLLGATLSALVGLRSPSTPARAARRPANPSASIRPDQSGRTDRSGQPIRSTRRVGVGQPAARSYRAQPTRDESAPVIAAAGPGDGIAAFPPPGVDPAPVRQLAAQATRALLQQLAGPAARSYRPPDPAAAARRKNGPVQTISGQGRSPYSVEPPAGLPTPADLRWPAVVARRIERRLVRQAARSPARGRPDAPVWGPQRPAAGVDPAPTTASPGRRILLEQWSLTLAGPTAEPALLARLAGNQEIDGRGKGRSPRATEAGIEPQEFSYSLNGGGEFEPETVAKLALTSSSTRSAARPLTENPGSHRLRSGAAAPPPDPAGQEGDAPATPSPPQLAPPRLAPELHPLRPPARPGRPLEPLAALEIRRAAEIESEATPAEADETLLAERIKRILDDEARRHGITV